MTDERGEPPVTQFAPGLHARTGVAVNSAAYEFFVGRWSRLFVPDVIAAAQVQSGSSVLDISTGTGEAAVGILKAIAASGIVVGADISPEMVRSAIERVNDSRFLPIAADGAKLPFRKGSFDAVICQLGLQFFPNPAHGLAEFRRVLRPGGRVSTCVISRPDRAPMWGFLAEAIARRLPEKRDIVMTSFALGDAKQFEMLFKQAGFVNVNVMREVRRGSIESLDAYWEPIMAGIGSIPQSYLLLSEGEQRAVRQEVTARLRKFMIGSELHLDVEMLIGHGEAVPDDGEPSRIAVGLSAPIDPRLGAMLACPKTKEVLEYQAPTNELVSRGAGLAFPIREGVPIMLMSHARQVAPG